MLVLGCGAVGVSSHSFSLCSLKMSDSWPLGRRFDVVVSLSLPIKDSLVFGVRPKISLSPVSEETLQW